MNSGLTIENIIVSSKAVLVRELTPTNLDDFYEGLPYRYNSIIDLVLQKEPIKETLLSSLHLDDKLFYRVFTISRGTSSLPILECLEIDGVFGGMLSTYLHDFDRDIIEGNGNMEITSKSWTMWQILMGQSEFSFVFPASRSACSRTSHYMKKIGFKEKRAGDLRHFFNGHDSGNKFSGIMRELIASLKDTSKLYSFNQEKFDSAKVKQAEIAKFWF
ncbi:MAG: hypothetical protein ACREPR_14045 [Brasilonema sp.]